MGCQTACSRPGVKGLGLNSAQRLLRFRTRIPQLRRAGQQVSAVGVLGCFNSWRGLRLEAVLGQHCWEVVQRVQECVCGGLVACDARLHAA